MLNAKIVAVAETGAFADVQSAIRLHGDDLRRIPGVIDVRPGYRFKNGWITSQPAVVVTVLRKLDPGELPATELIPRKLGSVLVDVASATPAQQLHAMDMPAHAMSALSQSPGPGVDLGITGAEGPHAELLAAVSPKPTVDYSPPPGVPLGLVEDAMTILCHAGPDAAWRVLGPFLGGTAQKLTVAMYELTSPNVATALDNAARQPGRRLNLILDPGNDPLIAGDTPEKQVVQDLDADLQNQMKFLWAAVRTSSRVTAGIFQTSYHIKVAVRDGSAFWLSSGNWKSSNQGTFDPISGDHAEDGQAIPPTQALPAGFLQQHDRDWHVVLEHPGLSDTLEKYILHDMEQAAPLQAPEAAPAVPGDAGVPGQAPVSAAMPDLFVPAQPQALVVTNPLFFRPLRRIFDAAHPLRIQPLLTPDNYAAKTLDLIRSAQERLYFQNQYIKPRDNNDPFQELVAALADRIQAGLDVRIILRTGEGPASETRAMLESLRQHGVLPDRIKLQVACHNKGIIVDSKTVLLGSHNWSDAGTTTNRDASLIFFSPEIAAYYEQIFLYDWDHQSAQFVAEELGMPVVAQAGEAPPEGMVRKSWQEVFGS